MFKIVQVAWVVFRFVRVGLFVQVVSQFIEVGCGGIVFGFVLVVVLFFFVLKLLWGVFALLVLR